MNHATEQKQPIAYTNRLPIPRLIILLILTSGLYIFYWYYRNWKQLKEYHRLNEVKPGWLTVGLIIPIYGVFLIYDLWNTVKKYSLQAGVDTIKYPGLLAVLFFTLLYLPSFLFSYILIGSVWPSIYTFLLDTALYVSVLLVIVYSQARMNRYWEKVENGKETYRRLTGFEIFLLVVGILNLVLRII